MKPRAHIKKVKRSRFGFMLICVCCWYSPPLKQTNRNEPLTKTSNSLTNHPFLAMSCSFFSLERLKTFRESYFCGFAFFLFRRLFFFFFLSIFQCFFVCWLLHIRDQQKALLCALCPEGIHVARQINNYRLHNSRGETISRSFDVKHERDQNYTEKRP